MSVNVNAHPFLSIDKVYAAKGETYLQNRVEVMLLILKIANLFPLRVENRSLANLESSGSSEEAYDSEHYDDSLPNESRRPLVLRSPTFKTRKIQVNFRCRPTSYIAYSAIAQIRKVND